MKFITFQPLICREALLNDGIYIPKVDVRYNGYEKIFALSVDEHTKERLFTIGPSMPQVCVVFETDEFEEVDSISWVNHLFFGLPYNPDKNCKYKEYTFDKIEKKNVVKMFVISDSPDVNEVQDSFFDTDFQFLCKLSGKKWKKLKGLFGGNIFKSQFEAEMFVKVVTNCIIPRFDVPLVQANYDSAINMINEYLTE